MQPAQGVFCTRRSTYHMTTYTLTAAEDLHLEFRIWNIIIVKTQQQARSNLDSGEHPTTPATKPLPGLSQSAAETQPQRQHSPLHK